MNQTCDSSPFLLPVFINLLQSGFAPPRALFPHQMNSLFSPFEESSHLMRSLDRELQRYNICATY